MRYRCRRSASYHIAVRGRFLSCPTNSLINARQHGRIAQPAVISCGSLGYRDLATCPTFISLNAELVACRTSTPWKLRQHKRRFWRSRDCDCFSRFKCFSAKLQSREECREKRTRSHLRVANRQRSSASLPPNASTWLGRPLRLRNTHST